MKPLTNVFLIALFHSFLAALTLKAAEPLTDLFAKPSRGFISSEPAKTWEHGILTGNGTMGAIVLGRPYDETLYLSHSSLYLPYPNGPRYVDMASHLAEIRKLALDGNYRDAGEVIRSVHQEQQYHDQRDPFIAAFTLRIKQPEKSVSRYQRAVNFMTAETSVSVSDDTGSYSRNAFISRTDDVIVLRLLGSGQQTAQFTFEGLEAENEKERKIIAEGVRSSENALKEGLLYFRTFFSNSNSFNPNLGYEGVGKVITKGGQRINTAQGISISGAKEILVLVKIRPIRKQDDPSGNFNALKHELDTLPQDYEKLLAPHAKIQAGLMGRVSLSLNAPPVDRAKSTEQLNKESESMEAPLAKIERAFDAGRYNIICSTGTNPPNLQGLWSGTWLAPWSGSFTVNGNLPCAVAFLLMGNTPELMESYFRYYDDRWSGFRENAKAFYGTRGFHVPAQLTLSPRETDFTPAYPHNYWHAGAAWAAQFYFDYYQYTGDLKFLQHRAYPLMKEAAAFYEDFLQITDTKGQLVFVPSFSPENSPGTTKIPTSINATIEFGAARQLLRNAIAAAKRLDVDPDLRLKWESLIDRMPEYQIGSDGSFREWLWPGLDNADQHRHASHLYALYDEAPREIIDNPKLRQGVEHSITERLHFLKQTGFMAFGFVQDGLAAAHIGNAELTEEVVNFLAQHYWSKGMASFHNRDALFNMDISGGFPYLCASTLVYADPGLIRFFPARPASWTQGSLKGVLLRGGIVVRELAWSGTQAKAVLISHVDQTITVDVVGGKSQACQLKAGVATTLDL